MLAVGGSLPQIFGGWGHTTANISIHNRYRNASITTDITANTTSKWPIFHKSQQTAESKQTAEPIKNSKFSF